jgi:phosphomannomutase
MTETPPIVFGTDGWRAVIADDFTYDNVRAVAQAVAWHLAGDDRPVVVGHDTRFSAELFSRQVARVLAANGKHVILNDHPVPTPVTTYTVVNRKAGGGVVVTASHNPAEFNGIKFKPDYGGSASPEVGAALEELSARALREGVQTMADEDAVAQGLIESFDPMPDYLAKLSTIVDLDRLRQAGLRILHEPMFGAGMGCISAAIGGGKTAVTELHSERNVGFGGMHPEPLAQYMPEAMEQMAAGGFDLCIANDGDADRVGIVDETGRFVNQLEVAALLAMYLLEKRGERGTIVRSLTSTVMLDLLGEKFGVDVIETPVGFKYIGPAMEKGNALLGCEESGGFGFRGHIPERDGILAGLLIADMIIEYGMPLSKVLAHLFEVVGPHAYFRHDIRFDREGYAERKQAVYARMEMQQPHEIGGSRVVRSRSDDGFKFHLEDGSWVLIRMSGTEPLMRVYSEAASRQRVDELLAAMEEIVGIDRPEAVGAGH